ncbi:hypothetical protein HDU82_003319 [Entophlyctis luteolus]|nr:hypothetical protein HDU82_003319 [Entophlyctis luteolus]
MTMQTENDPFAFDSAPPGSASFEFTSWLNSLIHIDGTGNRSIAKSPAARKPRTAARNTEKVDLRQNVTTSSDTNSTSASVTFEPSVGRRTSLVFSQKIVPATAAKPIATTDLVSRLKDLHSQLNKLEQETVDATSLIGIAKNLVSPSLVSHKDKAVKSLVSCCLADVLRLFAPDAPYNETELKVSQIPYVADNSGPYFENYYYLLESLAAIKSIILLTDLNAEDLVISLFKSVYGMVKPDFQKNVYGLLLQLLQCLLEESASIHSDIVELIYFGDMFYSSMKASAAMRALYEDDEDEDEEEHGATSHEDFRIATKMILEMNSACRGVLLNVIPLFEDQLKCEDEKVREMATDVLGKIFVDSGSRVAIVYPVIWRVWLDRRNDKSSSVRILWVQFCSDVFRHHPELCGDIIDSVTQKFLDPDDKVRLALVKVMGSLDAISLANVPKDLLLLLSERCKDKKMIVRAEAISALSGLFKLSYADIVSDENGASEKFGWIPGCILELLYLGDVETGILVERTLHEDIFVYIADDVQRTDRLLRIVGALTERQNKAFMSVIDKQATMMKDFLLFIEYCENWNGGIMDNDDGTTEEKLNRLILYLSDKFPDQKKAAANLQKFAKNNESRVYKLFRGVMNETADFKSITKNGKEIMKRLEAHSGLSDTFAMILRRISLTIVGKSSIPRLIEVAQSSRRRGDPSSTVDFDIARLATTAEGLIKKLASTFPQVYGCHLDEFLSLLSSDDREIVSKTLESLAKFVKIMSRDVKLTSGTIKQAKEASTILALLQDGTARKSVISKILKLLKTESLVEKGLLSYNEWKKSSDDSATSDSKHDESEMRHLLSWLVALGQFALYASADFEDIHMFVCDIIVRNILGASYVPDPHEGEDWLNFEELHFEGILKVVGVKLLVNRLRGLNEEAAMLVAKPVYKILKAIIENEGEILSPQKGVTCNSFKSHLRLVAAISVLKLSKNHSCDEKMLSVDDRGKVMLTIQDPCWQIRDAFVERLRKYLQTKVIPFRYMAIMFMAALEPDDDIKLKAKSFLMRIAKTKDKFTDLPSRVESVFVEFLHMVAHHPDFGTDDEDVTLSAKYIQFYIDIVASPENISFLFHSAAQLKMLVDMHSQTSDNIYHISDLAQFLVQEYCKHHMWTLNSYPTTIPYNRELFKRIASQQASNENVKKSYLSKKWMESIQIALAPAKTKGRRKLSFGKEDKERSNEFDEDDVQDEDEGGGNERTPLKKQKSGKRRASDEKGSAQKKQMVATEGKRKKKTEVTALRERSSRAAKSNRTYADLSDSEDDDSEEGDVDIRPQVQIEVGHGAENEEMQDSSDKEDQLHKPQRGVTRKAPLVPSTSDTNSSQETDFKPKVGE